MKQKQTKNIHHPEAHETKQGVGGVYSSSNRIVENLDESLGLRTRGLDGLGLA